MKLLIDANVVLDVLQDRKEFVRESSLLWKVCEAGWSEGYVSALAFADLVYIMRKQLDPEAVENLLTSLRSVFSFADLRETDLIKAASMRWDDYEDAVQETIAERIHADYIITRNCTDYAKSKVPAITPKEFIALV